MNDNTINHGELLEQTAVNEIAQKQSSLNEEYMKQNIKQNRQQLKLQCLNAAIHSRRSNEHDDKLIVTTAKAFYAFVRT